MAEASETKACAFCGEPNSDGFCIMCRDFFEREEGRLEWISENEKVAVGKDSGAGSE